MDHDVSSGAKARCLVGLGGTAEAVPFPKLSHHNGVFYREGWFAAAKADPMETCSAWLKRCPDTIVCAQKPTMTGSGSNCTPQISLTRL